MIFITSHT